MKPPLIALLTDFGLRDPYVGIMKGVILGRCPKASIVDISHGVPPQDVHTAAFFLRQSAPYFPDGSLFVVVVDPGVGSNRRILWAKNRRHSFLAPDNGALDWLEDRPTIYRSVENERLRLKPLSSTFHGRDIFAPTAAALANGANPSSLGPLVKPKPSADFPGQKKISGRRLRGEIVAIDHFGNVIASIDAAAAAERAVFFRGQKLGLVRSHYAQAKPGQALALAGSSGLVELSVREGNFAAAFKAKVGNHVELR